MRNPNELRARLFVFATLLASGLAMVTGCSLDVPKQGSGVTIKVQDQAPASPLAGAALLDELQALYSGPRILATGPQTSTDFGCFAVNVTGVGVVPASQKLQNCTSPTNMHGVGIGAITNTFPRGSSVTMGLPANVPLTVDVYGVFPPDKTNCPNAPPPPAGSTGGSNGGFFLGRVLQTLTADSTVTVPISFTAGLGPDVVCNNGGSNNQIRIQSVNPNGGISGTTVAINSGSLPQGVVITIGGLNCPVTNNQAPSFVGCTAPNLGTPGAYSVTATSPDGLQTVTLASAFNFVTSTAWITVDMNPANIGWGNQTVSTAVDHTLTVSNSGATIGTLNTPTPSVTGTGFTFKGGAYPGTGGTCATSLSAGTSCTVVLTFNPTATGTINGTVTVGGVTQNITGTGI